MSATPRCIPIAAARGVGAGGKAESLATSLGARASRTGCVFDHRRRALRRCPTILELAYENIGRGRVAVRSSSSDEDGKTVSFAGQHATVLQRRGHAQRCATRSFTAFTRLPRSARGPTGDARRRRRRNRNDERGRATHGRRPLRRRSLHRRPDDGAARPRDHRSRLGTRRRARGRKSDA